MLFLLLTLLPDEEFSELCEQTYLIVKRYVLLLTKGNVYSAEEILQNVYLLASEKKAVLLCHPNKMGWLFATAKNIHKQYAAKHNVQFNTEIELETDIPVESEFSVEYDELVGIILRKLSAKERALFIDIYINELSINDISKKEHENFETTKKAAYRLKQRLRKIVCEQFVN